MQPNALICRDDDARQGEVWGRSAFNLAGRARLEVFRAVLDRGPRMRDPVCIWQRGGRSVSVKGDTRMVPAWSARPGSRPSRPPELYVAQRDDSDRRRRPALGRAAVPGGRTSGRAGKAD